MTRTEGTFDITKFDTEDPHDDRDAVILARAHISKIFHGGLTGMSETDLITVQTDRPAAYAGIERFDRELDGRKGGFVLQHNAGGKDGRPWMTWKIVESSGTGELTGLRGEGQIVIGEDGVHSYVLDYDIIPAAEGRAGGAKTRAAQVSPAAATRASFGSDPRPYGRPPPAPAPAGPAAVARPEASAHGPTAAHRASFLV